MGRPRPVHGSSGISTPVSSTPRGPRTPSSTAPTWRPPTIISTSRTTSFTPVRQSPRSSSRSRSPPWRSTNCPTSSTGPPRQTYPFASRAVRPRTCTSCQRPYRIRCGSSDGRTQTAAEWASPSSAPPEPGRGVRCRAPTSRSVRAVRTGWGSCTAGPPPDGPHKAWPASSGTPSPRAATRIPGSRAWWSTGSRRRSWRSRTFGTPTGPGRTPRPAPTPTGWSESRSSTAVAVWSTLGMSWAIWTCPTGCCKEPATARTVRTAVSGVTTSAVRPAIRTPRSGSPRVSRSRAERLSTSSSPQYIEFGIGP